MNVSGKHGGESRYLVPVNLPSLLSIREHLGREGYHVIAPRKVVEECYYEVDSQGIGVSFEV